MKVLMFSFSKGVIQFCRYLGGCSVLCCISEGTFRDVDSSHKFDDSRLDLTVS